VRTRLSRRRSVVSSCSFALVSLIIFTFSELTLTLTSAELKDGLLAAWTASQTLKAELEGEVLLMGRLRTAINDLSAAWELKPANEAGEAARGDALVDQLCLLGATVRDRVRDALHTGVKRAMAIACSGFSYDMEVVSHGFVMDIIKTDVENEERLHALIDEAEGPGERLAVLFEPEVLPPETGMGKDEGDKDGAGGNDDQGM